MKPTDIIALLCMTASEILSMFISAFGITWVMPESIKDTVVSWSLWEVNSPISKIWRVNLVVYFGMCGQRRILGVLKAYQLHISNFNVKAIYSTSF